MARLRSSRSREGAAHPNILILCADDHRADSIGGFGHPLLRTPNWDRLLREGTAFTRAYTTIPICTPARAELLTGCGPDATGVHWFNDPINPSLTLLPVAFANAGYTTFYTGKWHNDGSPEDRGYAQVRRVFNGGMTDHRMTYTEDGREVTGFSSDLFAESVSHFLDSQRDSQTPWLAHVAFTAPHDPRTPPVGWRVEPRRVPLPPNFMPEHPFDNGEMTIRDECLAPWPRDENTIREHLADYYGMLLHLDTQVGRILAALDANNQRQRTIVVYTSDHGLAVGSHGLMGKMSMYEHSVRVPLLLRGPGVPEREEYDVLCKGADIFPTLCDLAGVPLPETVTGKSLGPILRGDMMSHRAEIRCHYRDVQKMVCDGRYKFIAYPKVGREQLFDLEADPDELVNLLDEWRFHPARGYTPPGFRDEYLAVADRLRGQLGE